MPVWTAVVIMVTYLAGLHRPASAGVAFCILDLWETPHPVRK